MVSQKFIVPDDGRKMGLEGMIEEVIKNCDISLNGKGDYKKEMTLGEVKDVRKIAREITNAENGFLLQSNQSTKPIPIFLYWELPAPAVLVNLLLPMKLYAGFLKISPIKPLLLFLLILPRKKQAEHYWVIE